MTDETFETEAHTIPVLKDVLRGADYTIKDWTITENAKGRSLKFTAERLSAPTAISEAQGEAESEE